MPRRRKKEIEYAAQDLIKKSLELATMHLDQLEGKVKQGQLTTQESFALCSYLKTFSIIDKNAKQKSKDLAKVISKMSDEELEAELKKHKQLFVEEMEEAEEAEQNEEE